jgi:hypothetical protein
LTQIHHQYLTSFFCGWGGISSAIKDSYPPQKCQCDSQIIHLIHCQQVG